MCVKKDLERQFKEACKGAGIETFEEMESPVMEPHKTILSALLNTDQSLLKAFFLRDQHQGRRILTPTVRNCGQGRGL